MYSSVGYVGFGLTLPCRTAAALCSSGGDVSALSCVSQERHERQLRSVSPGWAERRPAPQPSTSSIRMHFIKKMLRLNFVNKNKHGDLIYYSNEPRPRSESALVPSERERLSRRAAVRAAPPAHRFVVKLLHDLLDAAAGSPPLARSSSSSSAGSLSAARTAPIARQFGQQQISSMLSPRHPAGSLLAADARQAEETAEEIKRQLQERLTRELSELKVMIEDSPKMISFKSSLIVTSEMILAVDAAGAGRAGGSGLDAADELEPDTSQGTKKTLKSSLKQAGVQTDERGKEKAHKVQIDSRSAEAEPGASQEKETQTNKEKQD